MVLGLPVDVTVLEDDLVGLPGALDVVLAIGRGDNVRWR
jgi:hypothetical protein